MTKRRTMRFIQGNHYKTKNAVTNILASLEWRKENLPIILNDNMKKYLDGGVIYFHGRDK
jgi:hypothetical protein